MRVLPLLCIGVLSACTGSKSTTQASTPTSTSTEAKFDYQLNEGFPPAVYENQDGIRLTMVYLVEEAGQEKALIQFTGVRHPLSGKVLMATATDNGRSVSWMVKFRGEERAVVLVEERGRERLSVITTLVLPGVRHLAQVNFNGDLSRELDWRKMASLHESHVADGSLAALATQPDFDLAAYKESVADRIIYLESKLAKSCGKIPIEVDFSTVHSDSAFFGDPCHSLTDIVAAVCKRDIHSRDQVREWSKRIVCETGEENSIDWETKGSLRMIAGKRVQPKEKESLRKAILSKLGLGRTVLKSDSGNVLVFDPDDFTGSRKGNSRVYFGTEDQLSRQQLSHGRKNTIWTPLYQVAVVMGEKSWKIQCADGDVRYRELSPNDAKKILTSAKFDEEKWKRKPVSLSRDQRGTYYYVDRLRGKFGGKDYRVYRGLRGSVEQTQLIDIIDDESGKIFSTRQGKLRLVLGSKDAAWISGKKKQELTQVWAEDKYSSEPWGKTAKLIYRDLGVYDGQAMGYICE